MVEVKVFSVPCKSVQCSVFRVSCSVFSAQFFFCELGFWVQVWVQGTFRFRFGVKVPSPTPPPSLRLPSPPPPRGWRLVFSVWDCELVEAGNRGA